MKDEPKGREEFESGAGGGSPFARPWLAASILLLAAAAALLWAGLHETAFVAGALGASAWFYDVRARLKRRHDLVKLSGRNWVPREELKEEEDAEDEDDR